MRPVLRIALSLVTAAGFALAQDAPAPQGGWKPIGQPGSGSSQADPQAAQPATPPAAPALPAQLTLKAGTFITVRANQVLSSDRNHVGDLFTASLLRPIVVDGFVIAHPGQTIAGQVADAKKSGLANGKSRLGIQLTNLTLADGQQVPVQSELVSRSAPGVPGGVEAAAVGTTTAVGAGIGAVAAGGVGAAIGAGAGLAAGGLGVLLTPGRPTVIGPESVLTFKIDSDVTVATDKAPQAFQPVGPNDYSQPQLQANRPAGPGVPPSPGYAYPYYGYGYPYAYGYPYYPYYWGPGVGVYFGGVWGPRFYGRFR